MVSYIIPYVESRYDQLEHNLNSLDNQTDMDFEVMLVCQNCTCDITRPYMTKINITVVGQNPAKAQNVGVDNANGDIVVLTSPEVINAQENVAEMKKITDNTFWLGRVVEEGIEDISFASSQWNRENLLTIKGERHGVVALCIEEYFHPWAYFIGVIKKADFLSAGGVNEAYMDGIAWEDRAFSDAVTTSGSSISLNKT